MQYCYEDPFLKAHLFSNSTALDPTGFPKTPHAHEKITWGLGIGIFEDGDKKIAFHWGNNTGSHAFCAIDLNKGDSVACFVNSDNGPNIFQIL
ncbi:MAG: hypothetical protein AB7F64_07390, partial [Gammaproteobacteria bacterium]